VPYNNTKELPESVRHVLPLHAQEIYLSAFNNAYKEYEDKKQRRDEHESQEEVAHKVAWSAVKQKYEKTSRREWVEKN
jgi:cation transport regulator